MERQKIILNCVKKNYNGYDILSNINYVFRSGILYGITGRNGSGKTVLLKCISGLIDATEGTIEYYLDGEKCNHFDIGISLESPGFVDSYSGYHNLKMLASLRNKIGREHIKNTMAYVGLDPDLKKPVKRYSLGMKQRLGVAQAIMEDPSVIILDEPLNGLDEQSVGIVKKILRQAVHDDKIVIVSSHDVEFLHDICDVIIVVSEGNIKEVCNNY